MEKTIKEVITWFQSFLNTLYFSIFEPHLFFSDIYFKRLRNYTDPIPFLTICLIFVYSVQSTNIKYSSSYEKENIQTINSIYDFLFHADFLTQILSTLPLAFILYGTIKLIGIKLFKDKFLQKIFIKMGAYWMSSYCFLYSFISLLIALIVNSFLANELKNDVDFLIRKESYFPVFSYFLYYLQILGYIIPVFAILKFFKRLEKHIIKLLFLAILSGSSIFCVYRMINAQLQIIQFLTGDELEIYPSADTRFSSVSLNPTFLDDTTIVFNGNVYLRNKSKNEYRIKPFNSLLFTVDTTKVRLHPSCNFDFKLLDTLYGDIHPVGWQPKTKDETFIIKPKEKIPVNISFLIHYQKFASCMNNIKLNTSLIYSFADEDFQFKSSGKQLSPYFNQYNDCKSADSLTKSCIESLYEIIQKTDTYKNLIEQLEIKKRKKEKFLYKLFYGDVSNFRDSKGICHSKYEFYLVEGYHNNYDMVANFSFNGKDKTLGIYDESRGYLRRINFDKSMLTNFDIECGKSVKSKYYLE